MDSNETTARADFGFSQVPESEKAPLVRALFESVAPRYDLMNDLMSGGIHRWWKSEMVALLKPRPGQRLLDVAGGTRDIALRALPHLVQDLAMVNGAAPSFDASSSMHATGR